MDRVLIDTNVFMYAAGREHPHRGPCREVVRQLGTGLVGGRTAAVDAELFQEIAYRYASIGRASLGLQMQRSVAALPLEFLPVDDEVIEAFMALQERPDVTQASAKICVRDLLHVAVMQRFGIETILSTDRDFDAIEGIERLAPEAIA